MSTTPPPASQPSTRDSVRNYLGIAFALSIIVHLMAGPFLANYKPPKADKEVSEKVSVSKKIKVATPPPPTPTPPPPTPPPKSTPPPVKQTAPPPQPKLKLHVQQQKTTKSSSNSEQTYVPPPVGNEQGAPAGTKSEGKVTSASTAAPAPAAPPPTPEPTPTKPSCAAPHQDPIITNKVSPDYPDQARQFNATGEAQVKVSLSATGSVVDATIYKSAGNAALDAEARRAARSSSYTPEIENCQKIAGSYLFVANFDSQ